MSAMASTSTESMPATEQAIERLCAKHLHQCFWLPENASHPKLRVTYSVTTNFADTSLPAILFCTPMFGSRWLNVEFERLAKAKGVRVLVVDRPGMGGSTQIPARIRIETWLEIVPALLKHLDVKHVSLMCHSAGTMYCMNTLARLRGILDPEKPYVAFVAPWVASEQSKMTLWNMMSKLPVGMFSSWNSVAGFIQQRIAPSVAWSGGIISSVSGMLNTSTDEGKNTPGKRYGTSEEVGKEIERLLVKYLFSEDTTAGNEEAKLCLKKDKDVSWGACENYEDYMTSLCTQEREKMSAGDSMQKLKVQAFFAASDMMIGKGGQEYFDQLWKQGNDSGVIDFESKELPETDHDSALLDQDAGAMERIFEQIAAGDKS